MIRAKKKTVAYIAAAVLAVAALAAWLYVESTSVIVREIRVNLPHFSADDDGFSVALLSDPHFGPDDAGQARKIARITKDLAPDMILLLGDYINGSPDKRNSMSMEELTDFFSSLRAPYGVFAVTGNHELWYDREQVENALKRGGATVLTGKSAFVTLPSGQRLRLAGMPDFGTELTVSPPTLTAGPPTIVLMHDPNSAKLIPGHDVFGVAAHTHGGQFRMCPDGDDRTSLRLLVVRLKGKLNMIPNRPVILFDRGFTSFNGRRIFITSGLGAERVRLRTFCRPEIVLMRLYAADPEAAKDTYRIPEVIR